MIGFIYCSFGRASFLLGYLVGKCVLHTQCVSAVFSVWLYEAKTNSQSALQYSATGLLNLQMNSTFISLF